MYYYKHMKNNEIVSLETRNEKAQNLHDNMFEITEEEYAAILFRMQQENADE